MMNKGKSEGLSLITSCPKIINIENHCRQVHAEAVIESFRIAFYTPVRMLQRVFHTSDNKTDIERQTT
jgi:hypothetical protein